jgi:drug/metabolite transporter (DMT)-like permease
VAVLIGILIMLSTAAGQILLKKGADKQTGSPFINGFVFSGYIIFLLVIVLSYSLMKVIPFKYFTVIVSSGYVVAKFGAKLFLNEAITKNRILGTMLIAIGVCVFLQK